MWSRKDSTTQTSHALNHTSLSFRSAAQTSASSHEKLCQDTCPARRNARLAANETSAATSIRKWILQYKYEVEMFLQLLPREISETMRDGFRARHVVAALWLATSLGVASGGTTDYDVNREETAFHLDKTRKGGHTYIDSISVNETASSDGAVTNTQVKAVSEIKVEDMSVGGQRVDVSVKSFSFEVASVGYSLRCDLADDVKSSDEDCKEMYLLNDATFHMEIDDEGNVAKTADEDKLLRNCELSILRLTPLVKQRGC